MSAPYDDGMPFWTVVSRTRPTRRRTVMSARTGDVAPPVTVTGESVEPNITKPTSTLLSPSVTAACSRSCFFWILVSAGPLTRAAIS